MKLFSLLVLMALTVNNVIAQNYTISSKVEILWAGGWYPGKIVDIKNGKYKFHYDNYSDAWDTWVTKEELRAVGATPVPKQTPINNAKLIPINTKVSGTGVLYSGSTGSGSVFYYMYPSGQIVIGCPKGGLETFNYNTFCGGGSGNCGVYSKSGNTFTVTWNGGYVGKGKIHPNGDIDYNGSLIAPVKKVPNKIKGDYEFTMNLSGMSIAEVTTFKVDGTYLVTRNSGYDHNDGKNSAEWQSAQKGVYKINGYTMTMIDNGGKISKHTIYSLDESDSPEYLGWEGTFLARRK